MNLQNPAHGCRAGIEVGQRTGVDGRVRKIGDAVAGKVEIEFPAHGARGAVGEGVERATAESLLRPCCAYFMEQALGVGRAARMAQCGEGNLS